MTISHISKEWSDYTERFHKALSATNKKLFTWFTAKLEASRQFRDALTRLLLVLDEAEIKPFIQSFERIAEEASKLDSWSVRWKQQQFASRNVHGRNFPLSFIRSWSGSKTDDDSYCLILYICMSGIRQFQYRLTVIAAGRDSHAAEGKKTGV